MPVQEFVEVREDKKEIPSYMTASEMLKLGWQPSPIKKVKWVYNDREYSYQSPYSLSACIIYGGEYIALVERLGNNIDASLLHLISADGTSQITVSNTQIIKGCEISGQFQWFESYGNPTVNILGIVFRSLQGSDAYLLNIDATTGYTIAGEYIRT